MSVISTTVHRGSVGEAGSMYTRVLATDPDGPNAGALLLTWELRLRVADPGGPVFPIYRSEDGGLTWEPFAEVADTRFGFGNRYQPMIYELESDFAHLARGTLLLAGNAIPADGSATNLVIYSSQDGGATWQYETTVDSGGPAVYHPERTSTTTAIWEPDLRVVDGVLYCFYADERYKDRQMLQVIARRSTSDLREWSDPDLIAGVPDSYSRPGMFVSTSRMPDGWYRAVIEVVGPREVPIHLIESPDGVDWGDPADLGRRLISGDGVALSGTPNIAWAPDGRGGAVLIATARHTIEDGRESNKALVSTDHGVTWRSFELPTPAERRIDADSSGYSQSVRWNARGQLVQATTIRNEIGSHDVVVTVADAADVLGNGIEGAR